MQNCKEKEKKRRKKPNRSVRSVAVCVSLLYCSTNKGILLLLLSFPALTNIHIQDLFDVLLLFCG